MNQLSLSAPAPSFQGQIRHAIWLKGRRLLAVWGERLPRRAPSPGHHPTTLSIAQLRQESEDLEWAPSGTITLLLPTLDTTAVSRRLMLHPQKVPALLLPSGDALDWLRMGASGRGASALVLAEVARLAHQVVAAGCFTPSLLEREGRHEARWTPSRLPGEVASRLAALAAALPAAARAALEADQIVVGRDWARHTCPAPRQVALAAFEAFVDQICRDGLGGAQESLAEIGDDAVAVWTRSLTSSSAWVGLEPTQLEALSDQIQRAVAPPPIEDFGHLRLCLRLVEPEDEGDRRGGAGGFEGWRLAFMLQSKADPSLLVPAEQIWESASLGEVAVLAGASRLLRASLARAAQIWPPMERALMGASPCALDLSSAEALEFLRKRAAEFTAEGITVLAPVEPKTVKVGLKARVDADAASQREAQIGAQALMNVDWTVALGDQALTLAELRRIAELKAPLVRMNGRWVEFRPEHAARALRFMESRASEPVTAVEALRSGLGLESPQLGLPIVSFEATGALGELLKGTAKPSPMDAPPTFQGTLRPYQRRGLSWLSFMGDAGLGACLADDMGLGKTVQVLALLLRERADGQRPPPTLLICPMSVVGNWAAEARRFAPGLQIMVHHGASRRREGLDAHVQGADVVITTYALAHRDLTQLSEIVWGRLVLDEAQNIKNSAARQTKAIRSLKAASRLALTGTPVENRLSELWSIMTFLNPGLLGTARAFDRIFAEPIEVGKDSERAELLRRLVQPFLLRRLKTDPDVVQDLPDKLEFKVHCSLSGEQATLYQATVDAMVESLDAAQGFRRKGVILSTMLKLKQICDHPALVLGDIGGLADRSHKLERLIELLDAICAVGDKTLVFTQFSKMGALLEQHIKERLGVEVQFLHGGTPRKTRDRMVEAFQSPDGPQVFILSIKAGGTGLNLTAATQVIHFDRWWNPAVEDQATDRAYRIGQKRKVQVRKLICMGTLEEKIDAMIDAKRALADQVVGAGDAWLTELSTDALREVVTLAAELSDG